MLKNEMESYVRIGRRGLKNRRYPYMGVGKGSKIAKISLTQLMNGPLQVKHVARVSFKIIFPCNSDLSDI